MANTPLSESWMVNHRVNMLLLDALSEENLAVSPNARARSIGDQFAHLNNARLLWLETMAPAAVKTLKKIEKGTATKKSLAAALHASAEVMRDLFVKMETEGKPKGGKRGPVNFFAYIIAHEAHHRGQIILHLKYAGITLPKEIGFGIWEWDKI